MLVQIVFLIDTDIDRCFKDSPVLLSNAVCRSCFRLLHHFSSTFEKRGTVGKSRLSQTNVKWGYKFFSRHVGQSRIESHKLYDFKLKYFEEFENDVNQRFESSYNLQRSSVLKSVKPVDSLNRAFTELLADFQLENPDLMSPVKGRRNKKEELPCSNHVFLFSKCPKNGFELKEFTGKQVPDEDVLLYSMLPNTLFQQFCKVARLSMHWIDTEHVSFLTKPDLQSVQIVEKAVGKAGGCLTVLDAIVKNGNHHFTDVHLLYDEEATEQEVASYVCKNGSNTSGLIPNTSFIDSLLSREVKTDKKSSKHKNHEVSLQLGNQQFVLCLKAVDKGSRSNHGNKRMLNCFKDEKNPSNPPTDIKHLQGYGLLPKHSVGSLCVALQSSYLCTSVNPVLGKKQEVNNVGKFNKLLSTLVAEGLILVLLSEESGQFILLSPTTVCSATLSTVAMEKSLTLEKQMLLSSVKSSQTVSHESCQHEELIDRLVSSVHVSKQTDLVENTEVSHFDSRQMDRWIIPGQTETLQRLVTKLYSRISDLDFLSPDETGLLKELQKYYKQHNKPPGLRDTVVPTTDHDVLRETTDQFELPYKGKSSRMSLSRTDMILCKSKAMVRERGQVKEDAKSEDKPDRNKLDVAAHLADFSSVEELKHYLVSTYQRVSSGEMSGIDSTVQSMVTVAFHYMKQSDQTVDVQEKCIKLLEETVLMTGAMLREKFIKSPDVTAEQKIAEYQTQVLLRMEIISSLQNKDQDEEEDCNEEIVGFLRALSFISEAGLLSKFMESSLVSNYIHSIPQTLANLFDELMQPLPEALANILSPENVSPTGSVLNDSLIGGPPSARTRSHGSVGPASSQMGSFNLDTSLNKSRGGRKLVHHYSVDLGAKRQIVVDKMPNKKAEKQSSKKKKASHKHSKEKVAKALFGKQRDGVKLERRQSVAVMQPSNKTPKKQQLHKSPRRYASPRRKLVAETPTHKQVSHIMKKESLMRRHSLADGIMSGVVAESPEKACDTSLRESPTKGKRTKALLRRSFYSAGPVKRTKNLTQYFQLADRIAGRKRQASGSDDNKPAKLLKLEPSSQFKSPDKNASFLLSQLVASPSPAKTTPRKRNMTPQKLIGSPSQYTRSKLGMSPSVDLFRSPSRRQKIASPAPHLMESPITRRQSPRILVADSDVKDGPKSPIVTPEKSPVRGVVPFGLNSPSHNTRQKTSQTPTRRSVRAALFAKSPATSRRESPFRGTASPRTLLQKFGSPLKNVKEFSGNMISNASQAEENNLKHTSRSPTDNVNDQNKVQLGQSIKPLRAKVSQQVCFDNFETEQTSAHHQTVRTPPGKKITKTPDSFDKWHRRKPRMSQTSPSTNKITMETKVDKVHGIKNSVNDDKVNVNETLSPRSRGMSRNKRSLVLSPDKTLNPSNKRRRTLKSELGLSTGSQGFDVSSFDELSQISTASSLDYFSSTNDDVFLSQNSVQMDFEDTENENCVRNNSVLKNKALERLQSDNVPMLDSSQTERSDSPIFGCSKAIRTRNRSGNLEIKNTASIDSSFQSGALMEQNSPKPGRHSPIAKKFSPNVSAKSLMHLIQSPLLKSPDAGSNKSDKLKKSHIGERSRRSLKLQN